MSKNEAGPITTSMFRRKEGEPPAVIKEWGETLHSPGDFVCYWAGAIRRSPEGTAWARGGPPGDLGWGCFMTRRLDEPGESKGVREMSAAAVERLLSPLAHEGRVRIMQALFDGPLGASQLADATGFHGGGLYHHLRELEYADYIASEDGGYRLTNLGCELLVTVLTMATMAIEDRGERGLGVSAMWQDRKKKQ